MHVRPFLASLLLAGLGLAPTVAAAPNTGSTDPSGDPTASQTPRVMTYEVPEEVAGAPAAIISNILYINRCATGCTLTQAAASSSRLNQTYLGGDLAGGGSGNRGSGAPGTVYNLSPWGYPDATWNAMVACIRETYAPYDVIVTDVDPGPTVAHHEAIVAGTPDELGLNEFVGGVGPLFPNCALHEDTVSFSFSNIWPNDAIFQCSTVAQETAHGFGLEHAFNCADPMTYLPACNQQFFRNDIVSCGAGAPPDPVERPCTCGGGKQNTHSKLLAVFGPNPTPLPAPVVNISVPTAGATLPAGDQFAISATGVDKRGVKKAEIWFNGYRWDTLYAARGQSNFVTTAPANLPDGVVDVELRIYNDLETVYGTQTVTVTKGAPCVDASSCRDGQQCAAGKCFWDPPVGNLGDACDYAEYCVSAVCQGNVCSQDCTVGISGFCPDGYECVGTGAGTGGYCLAGGDEPGGCCSVGTSMPTAGLLAQLGLAGLVLGGVLRRRRNKR